MLDINLLRNNFEEIKENLQKKGFEFDVKAFKSLISGEKNYKLIRSLFKKNLTF